MGNYKSRLLLLVLITTLALPSLFSCDKAIKIDFSDEDTKLFIVSDTHFIAESLLDRAKDYDALKSVTDGRTITYATRVLDEAIKSALKEKPDYFIVTGDLTSNGAKKSHEEFALKLKTLSDNGITPLVIPGNHDVYNANAIDMSTVPFSRTNYITFEEYEEIYKDCGYTGNYSYDPDSESYIVETKNNEWLLMLDTTLSKYNYDFAYVHNGGYFESMDWLKTKLKEAKDKGIERIYSFSHHNLVNHNPLYERLYDIGNKSELQELYTEYDITLNFSGHLHIQDIATQENIKDIATGSLVDYGNRYGIFQTNAQGYTYESKQLEFKLDNGQDYSDYSYDLFYNRGYEKFLVNFRNIEDETERETLSDFQAKINCYYFDGTVQNYYKKLLKEKGYKLATTYIENFNTSYLGYMIELGNKENHQIVNLYQ